jgi:hypothetical protein
VTAVTATEPAALGGETTVIWVSEFTVTFVAAASPNRTWVAAVKFVPVSVTVVPPAIGPEG